MMVRTLLSLSLLALANPGVHAQQVIVQFGPTTEYSTLNCANFRKIQPNAWRAINAQRFGLGFVQNIVPPITPIVSGNWIYNNIDLYSQLELQCGGIPVIAKY